MSLCSQYSNANSTDMWNIINQEARRTHTISGRMNVARIMKTWTHQPGYPLVHVHRGKNGILHISQVSLVIKPIKKFVKIALGHVQPNF
jgi:aminopeptidase N